MPLVEVEERVPAPVATVWDLVNDVEAYPGLIEHIRSAEVLERGADHRLTAWEVELKGCLMRWVEREEIDPERFRIDYRQVEGDLKEFTGFWQLDRLDDVTTRVVHSVRFEIGLPMLSEMLDPVAENAIRENSRSMLRSLASQAGASVS